MSEEFTPKGPVRARKFDGSEESAQGIQDWLGEPFRVLWVKDLSQKAVPAHLAINQPNGGPVQTLLAGNYLTKIGDGGCGAFDAALFESMFG